jgi:uncharacterized membrane protein
MKIRLPESAYNFTSLTGATIAIISFFMIAFLFIIAQFHTEGGAYLGLVIYIILPVFLIFGLILIPIGMYLKKKKIAADKAEGKFPKIDLNNVRHRNAFFIFAAGTVVLLFISAFGSYEAFHYTESVEFCGTVCHTVMEPEFVAYQNSPHARVKCVECHVGEGADWYMRSKLSGLYQVYAAIMKTYPKPIPTPISNLRPARETCERCHWPEKFYANELRIEKHYLSDEENTPWDIYLKMKIGASHSARGLEEGIHWHINPNIKVEYAATDDQRENIPWVRYTDLVSGEVIDYIDEYSDFEKSDLDTLIVRKMDCMDCHNRPSHSYQPPAFFVNNALSAGTMPADLPEIKYLAMEICAEEFSTMDTAMIFIENEIQSYYEENYPEEDKEKIDLAVTGLQNEFKKNIFPEMKVRWDVYPNHIGHVEFNGCFRCHNESLVSDAGYSISNDCNMCHTIIAQGNPDNLEVTSITESLEFKHPSDIDEAWKEMVCVECHTGLNP